MKDRRDYTVGCRATSTRRFFDVSRKSCRPIAYVSGSNYDRRGRVFISIHGDSSMAILSTLLAFTLRQASIESGEQIVDKVRGWLVDPSLDLHKAIKKAN